MPKLDPTLRVLLGSAKIFSSNTQYEQNSINFFQIWNNHLLGWGNTELPNVGSEEVIWDFRNSHTPPYQNAQLETIMFAAVPTRIIPLFIMAALYTNMGVAISIILTASAPPATTLLPFIGIKQYSGPANMVKTEDFYDKLHNYTRENQRGFIHLF